MLETHPFSPFCPPHTRYLLLGSFTANSVSTDPQYDWYYSSKRNQFWRILEQVYARSLPDKAARQQLFTDISLAVADIIYRCRRRASNSLDNNLIDCVYNTAAITNLLTLNPIRKIFFSSRFVEANFKRHFKPLIAAHPQIELITLPSPSPRYATLSLSAKVARYRELFPVLLQ